jgi:hypothetical protein
MKVFAAMLLSSLAVFVSPAHGQCNIRENIFYSDPIYTKVYVTVKVPDGRYISVPVVNGILPSIDEKPDGYDGYIRTYTYTSGKQYTGGTPSYKVRLPAPQTTETYEREAPRASETRTRAVVIEEDGDRPRYGGGKDLEEIRKDLQRLRDRIDKEPKEREPMTSPLPKDTKELEEAKQAILELREEVKKLTLLTLKYETEKKQAMVVPPTVGMVKPSEMGKKKE